MDEKMLNEDLSQWAQRELEDDIMIMTHVPYAEFLTRDEALAEARKQDELSANELERSCDVLDK